MARPAGSTTELAARVTPAAGHPIQLPADVRWTPLEDGWDIELAIRNPGPRPVAAEVLTLFDVDLGVREQTVFREGFNMPGDPAGFYRLTAGQPAPVPKFWLKPDEPEHQMASHTLAVWREDGPRRGAPRARGWPWPMRGAGAGQLVLLGFASFDRFEGHWLFNTAGRTIRLSARIPMAGLILAPGERVPLERFLVLRGRDFNEILARYADRVGAACGARVPRRTATGWIDWQYYREEKTEREILAAVRGLQGLKRQGAPLRYIIVDGGWCAYASEWLKPCPKFPDMPRLMRRVRRAGFEPGLWFAPYITNVRTEVARRHPDWMVRDAGTGRPLFKERSNVGPCWMLDYTVPAALEWLRRVVRVFVREWGLGYLKLDGPSLAHYRGGRFRDPRATPIELARRALAVIRAECGERVLVEGEGIYGPSIGYVDIQRTTQDAYPCWHDLASGRPVLKENLKTDLLSAFLHRRFWHVHRENVILRDFPSPFHGGKARTPASIESVLTENQLRFQLSAAALAGGAMLLTDPPLELARAPDRFGLIGRFLPHYEGGRCRVLDAFGRDLFPSLYTVTVERPFERWHVLGVFNWGDTYRDVEVPLDAWAGPGPHHAFEFWTSAWLGRVRRVLRVPNVPAQGCAVIALRAARPGPQLVGTDLHLFQGAVEFESLEYDRAGLHLAVRHFDQRERSLFLYLPPGTTLRRVRTDARDYLVDARHPPIVRIRFNGRRRTEFRLAWRTGNGPVQVRRD